MKSQQKANLEVVQFYRGEITDQCGRYISDILKQNQDWLEHTHDYIQWLFPLTESSAFNSLAPILTKASIKEFQADKMLKERLASAFRVMLRFYGLESVEDKQGGVNVTRHLTFESRRRTWLTPTNHNFLRITRMLKSLSLLGLNAHSQAFLRCLREIYEEHDKVIGKETFCYWQNAVQ